MLYGRHWGCAEQVKHLHLKPVDQGIDTPFSMLQRSTGGEHKISRGFIPVPMQSSHWLTVNPFVQGIADFVKQEQQMIDDYMQEIWQASPYRENEKLQQLVSELKEIHNKT
ncbi:conserved hypothetical protein [uncultured Thiomicrorhabdus sp.]